MSDAGTPDDAGTHDDAGAEHASAAGDDAAHELISRLRLIEDQPLAGRAEAYAALHDELARRLEAGPAAGGAAG